MATGRYNRIDNNRRSSSKYGSTVTVFLFVSLCLVVVWMMTSSSVVPVQTEVNAGVADEELNELYGEVSKRTNDVSPGMFQEKDKVDTGLSQEKKNEVKPEVSQQKNEKNVDLSQEKKNEVKTDASQEKNEINVDVRQEKDEVKPDVSQDENEPTLDGPQKKKNEVKPDVSQGKSEINMDVPQEKKEEVKPDVSQEKNEVNMDVTWDKKNEVKPDLTQEKDEVNTDVPQDKKKEGRPDVSQENDGVNLDLPQEEKKEGKPDVSQEKNEGKVEVSQETNEGNMEAPEEKKTESKEKVTDSKENNMQQFEDNHGDLPEDVTKKDQMSLAQNDSKSNTQDNGDENFKKKQRGKAIGEENKLNDGSKGDGEKKKEDSDSKIESGQSVSGTGGTKIDMTVDGSREHRDNKEGGSIEKKDYSVMSGTKFASDESEKKHSSEQGFTEKKTTSDLNEVKSDSDKTFPNLNETKSDSDGIKEKVFSDNSEKTPEKNSGKTEMGDTVNGKTKEIVDQVVNKSDARSGLINQDGRINQDGQVINQVSNEVFPPGAQSEILNESTTQSGSWSTQSVESKKEKEAHKSSNVQTNWKFCNVTAGPDYIPCLDNWKAIKSLPTTMHYEHRERHCPEEPPTCLVPLPDGYKRPIKWPMSRDKIWYHNVPHIELVKYKGGQNWVKFTGEYLTFPGGGTQFKRSGAFHYIDFLQESVSDISWGNRSRVVLDVGCGVASFGGYLFDRDVLTMSLAPKDEHEAQVQFALERGIPAISAVMGTKRLPFPGGVFDVIHCARCRVPWHIDGGILLLELNRLLRPGGLFVWSATPVYQKRRGDVEIWTAMKDLTKNMCWETVAIVRDRVNRIGVAIYKKPTFNECYKKRSQNKPPICGDSDDPNAAWNVTLGACMHRVPVESTKRGSQWPQQWPARVESTPYWLLSSQTGVYGKPAPDDFVADCEHWKHVVNNSYLNGIGIDWSAVRNVMDMRAVYGGFAAALKDLNIWVMNVVPVSSADTLPVIYERGLFGIYHDWCESFSTYPRSYDLLHADHIFSTVKETCNLVAVVAEVDRILRPEGKLIVRDNLETIKELEEIVKSMHWELRMTYFKEKEGLLSVEKSMWRPKEPETLMDAIA